MGSKWFVLDSGWFSASHTVMLSVITWLPDPDSGQSARLNHLSLMLIILDWRTRSRCYL